MKKKIFALIIVVNFCGFVFSQGDDCDTADPFCAGGNTLTFPNQTGVASQGAIGCLGTSPNPAWFYFKISQAGDLDFALTQGNNAPSYDNFLITQLNSGCNTGLATDDPIVLIEQDQPEAVLIASPIVTCYGEDVHFEILSPAPSSPIFVCVKVISPESPEKLVIKII